VQHSSPACFAVLCCWCGFPFGVCCRRPLGALPVLDYAVVGCCFTLFPVGVCPCTASCSASAVVCDGLCFWVCSDPCVCLSFSSLLACHFSAFPSTSLCNAHLSDFVTSLCLLMVILSITCSTKTVYMEGIFYQLYSCCVLQRFDKHGVLV
jgi:hypothetical protein